jgi:hypothetical protein
LQPRALIVDFAPNLREFRRSRIVNLAATAAVFVDSPNRIKQASAEVFDRLPQRRREIFFRRNRRTRKQAPDCTIA